MFENPVAGLEPWPSRGLRFGESGTLGMSVNSTVAHSTFLTRCHPRCHPSSNPIVKSYRDLVVWNQSTGLVLDIRQRLPRTKTYGLTSQLWRAAVSVPVISRKVKSGADSHRTRVGLWRARRKREWPRRYSRRGPDSQPPSVLSAKAQLGSRLTTGHGSLATDHG
jgi:hypothetical protein